MKSLKKLFVSIFILNFSLVYFLGALPASASSLPFLAGSGLVDEDAALLFKLHHTEGDDFFSRLFNSCCITKEVLGELDGEKLRECYTLMCKNLPKLIRSQSDYEEMYDILRETAWRLFGRDLSEEIFIEDSDYENFIELYETIRVSDDFNLNLFTAIFVYSCVIDKDSSSANRKCLEKILRENGISCLDFSMNYIFNVLPGSEESYPSDTDYEGSSCIDAFGAINRKIYGKDTHERTHKRGAEEHESSRRRVKRYRRTYKNHDADSERWPGYTQLYGRQKK